MNDRDYDLGDALAGLVFMVAGVVFLLESVDVLNIRNEVIVPAMLIGLGFALLLSTLSRPRPPAERLDET